MKNIAIIILILIFTWPLCTFAAQQTPPYPTTFWLIGNITAGNTGLWANQLRDFKIVFYKNQNTPDPEDNSGGYATGFTDASAKYNVNAHDDLRLLPLTSAAAPDNNYYIAIVKTTKNGVVCGKNETGITITEADLQNGYKKLDNLELKVGDGIIDPDRGDDTGLIYDTKIERVGADIKLSWKCDPSLVNQRANIWRLTDSQKEYSTSEDWLLVEKNVANNNPWTDPFVKAENGENAYYRVIPSGAAFAPENEAGNGPFASHDQKIFDPKNNARTVGKFDVEIFPPAEGAAFRYNFISSPLVQYDENLDSVFGKQLPSSSRQAKATEIWGWTGTSFGDQAYLSQNGWVKINTNNDAPNFKNEYGVGYIIKTKSGQEQVFLTLVGMVNTDFAYNGKIGVRSNMYTSLGDPIPKTISLANLGLNEVLRKGNDSGLGDQLWGWTGSSFGSQAYLHTSGEWMQVGGVQERLLGFGPGKAYLLKRINAQDGKVDWRMIVN